MKKSNIAKYLLSSLFIILIINVLCCLADIYFGISPQIFTDLADKNGFITDLFLVDVQVTFIIVSLSTVLTTQTGHVYWEDIFQYRLIKPKFWNFTAITSYLLSTLIAGVIVMIIDKCLGGFYCTFGIISDFLITLVLMIILSVRMIAANFGKEALKKELEEQLKNSMEKYHIVDEHIGFDKGLRIPEVRQLVQVTVQELENRQLDLACENMDLLFRFGLYHELKRCYDYAISCTGSDSIMDEVNYSLMSNALENSQPEFFSSPCCPIPFRSQVRLWDDFISTDFDKAAKLFIDGQKEEAFLIRANLYKAFLYFASRNWPGFGKNEEDISEDTESIRYDIIRLAAAFVDRRTKYRPLSINGEYVSMDKAWEINELEIKENDRDELSKYTDTLNAEINSTLDRWVDIDDDFLNDSLYLDWEILPLARNF